MWGSQTPSGVSDMWQSLTPAGIFRKFGTDAHVWIPGIGSLNGAMAANYVESTFVTGAAVDGVVGGAKDNFGGIHATQATTANKPVLRRGAVNLLTHSEDFSNVVWANNNGGTGAAIVKTPNYGIAPDGTTTACRLQLNKGAGATTTDISELYQNFAGTYQATRQVWVKTISGSAVVIVGGTAPVTVTTAWQNFQLTSTIGERFRIMLRGGQTPVCSDTADLLIWHPMLEIGSVASPYIPTTTAPASAGSGKNYWAFDGVNDTLLIPSSPIQTQDDSVLIGCAKTITPSVENALLWFRTITPIVSITIGGAGGICAMLYRDDAATTSLISSAGGTVLANTSYVITGHKVGNNKKLRLNGVQQQATETTVLGTSTTVNGYIGSDQGGGSFMNGNIYCAIAIKGTVSDAELKILERWAGLFGGVAI